MTERKRNSRPLTGLDLAFMLLIVVPWMAGVVEEFDRMPATASGAGYKPLPNILEGPITTEPQANHIAHTRFGMEVR
jgi:hypothetical protein